LINGGKRFGQRQAYRVIPVSKQFLGIASNTAYASDMIMPKKKHMV
jgi:hypothetical protein